jgi:dienelactone hydrolase
LRNWFVLAVMLGSVGALPASASAQVPEAPFPNSDCYAPAGDPEPGSDAWRERDTKNQICATLRLRDQFASPAFGYAHQTAWPGLHAEATAEQATDPTHPRGGITTLIPGSRASDPFRTLPRWEGAGLGSVERVTFPAQNGSTLRGWVFTPPSSVPQPEGGYPGVVITDGSVQGYQHLYFWAAQDLAANGYIAMTYDVQGQGDSDLAGSDCPGDCSGVPFQQAYNFYQGAEDSLSFFVSDANPAASQLDADRVGLAGHSLGAGAVSQVGQCDARVKAIVAWDNLSAPSTCSGATIAPENQSGSLARVPAIGISNDYGFWTQPTDTPPNREAKVGGFKSLVAAGVDSAEVVLRGATHLEYTYIDAVLPASRLGERMASYYTVAWFDQYLKGDASAFDRLVATSFDGSADASSIGAGDFDVDRAAAAPTDPLAGNVPYRIEGMAVENAVSFYYRSAYSLTSPAGGKWACGDLTDASTCTREDPDGEGEEDPSARPGRPAEPGRPVNPGRPSGAGNPTG